MEMASMLQSKDIGKLNRLEHKTHMYAVYRKPTSEGKTQTD